MNLLYIKGFNNYYNRKVKFYENLSDYMENYESQILTETSFNFNDGVTAQHIINWFKTWIPDYMLVVDELGEIVSRWFVLEIVRTRNGQYSVSLRRDVIADHYKQLLSCPMLVQKGNVSSENPLIFNKESDNYNQIKKEEILLKDNSETAWIVGYILKDAITTETTIEYDQPEEGIKLEDLNINFNDETDYSAGGTIYGLDSVIAKTGFFQNIFLNILGNEGVISASFSESGSSSWNEYPKSAQGTSLSVPAGFSVENRERLTNRFYFHLASNATDLSLGIDNHLLGKNKKVSARQEINDILNLNGKIIQSNLTQKHYKIIVTQKGSEFFNESLEKSNPSDVKLYQLMESASKYARSYFPDVTNEYRKSPFWLEYTIQKYSIELYETTVESTVSVTLKPTHRHTDDAPYDVFALPFNEDNLCLAQKISEVLTKANVLDLQILPYCPVMDLVWQNSVLDVTGMLEEDYSPISNGSYLLWSRLSSGSFIIPISIDIDISDPIELKVENECNMYRLVSPNYNGAYEFSPAKNLGVNYFEVSFTYKPYSPYIQVNPKFKNLYGGDFNDARGLICNGDFSIATLTDAWQTYEVNNKNFQNIFNTEIKTMDISNRNSLISQAVSVPINAATTGLATGVLGGGIVGGIAAGAASLAGGAADIALGQSTYQANRQAKIDIFNMQLQNVRALPDTLNKISAYNIVNKYFPFIEKYTATDIEKDALRSKLKYEGMTLGVIGKMSDYINYNLDYNYFKAQLIIAENINDDFHVVDAIGVELEKGIYLQ